MKTGKDAVRERIKSWSQLARDIGVQRSAVSNWKRVPAERLGQVAALTGLPHEVIRPDLFERIGPIPDRILSAAIWISDQAAWPENPVASLVDRFDLHSDDAYRAVREAERMKMLRSAHA